MDSGTASQPNSQNQSNSDHELNISNLTKTGELDPKNYGHVEIYENPTNSQLIAVKTLFQLNENPDVIHEIQEFQKLNYKFVAPILSYNVNPLRIATKYANKGSLKDFLLEREKGINNILADPNSIAKLVVGIVLGMRYLHSNQMYHLDLKPSNILIDEDGSPIITDYFNRKLVDLKYTFSNQSELSFYSPPEQYTLNIRSCDQMLREKIDSFSFSLILFELLFGRPVFNRHLSSDELQDHLTANYRPNVMSITSDVNPVVRELIQQCWDKDTLKRLQFYEIYQKLKGINFKITPNVDSEMIIRYIDSKKMNVNVKLWSGEVIPIEIEENDHLFDIRYQISEKAHINFHDVILSRNNRPLMCCFNCMVSKNLSFKSILDNIHDKEEFMANPLFELVIHITAIADEYPIYKEPKTLGRLFNIYTNEPNKNETSFVMKPGTIQDMIDKIVDETRNLWFLKDYKLKIKYNNYVRFQNESMIDDGITNNSKIIVDICWNTWVEINERVVRCNLDDPLSDLIFRYVMFNKIDIDGVPYLNGSGVNAGIDSNLTIKGAGIFGMNRLQFCCIKTNYYLITKNDKKLYYDPKYSMRTLKLLWMMITKTWKPIGALFHIYSQNILNDDESIEEAGIVNGSKIDFIVRSPIMYDVLQY